MSDEKQKLPVLVIAGSARQFDDWCRVNQLNPNNRSAVSYVAREYYLNGRFGNEYVLTGTYYLRPDWAYGLSRLLEYLRAAGQLTNASGKYEHY